VVVEVVVVEVEVVAVVKATTVEDALASILPDAVCGKPVKVSLYVRKMYPETGEPIAPVILFGPAQHCTDSVAFMLGWSVTWLLGE
jgi:hypothetical protein